MKKNQVWLPLLLAVILVLGMMAGYTLREKIPPSQGFFQSSRRSALQEALDLIRLKYVDPVSTDSLTDDGIQAMLAHLDPHSLFIPAKYLQEVNEDLQGNFQGIGVEFQIISDTVHVVSVLPEGPSAKAGLQVGDKFLKVGDSLVAGNGITAEKIKDLLRGPSETRVHVEMLRDTHIEKVDIQRSTIPLYSVDASYMINDTTGFIHLNKFSGTSYEECMMALEKLKSAGMKKLIFDLRNNGGGILSEAVDIADEFLSDEKLIVYTKGDKLPMVEYKCKRPGLFEEGKIVILTDEGSASASEVLAGAIQDWDRGTIVGRRTFGKGLVQEQYELSDGGAIRLTVARYYTPSGRSIQKSYANGRTAYNEEIMERFHNSGLTQPDTTWIAGAPTFKTKGGRTVYGGGGIMPDVFVPFDTTGFQTDMSALFANQQFGKFIYLYYLAHKAYFSQFKDAKDYAQRFQPGEDVWKSLMSYTASQHILMPTLPKEDRNETEKRIKTWMARQLYGMPGYYVVNNEYDMTVKKALETN